MLTITGSTTNGQPEPRAQSATTLVISGDPRAPVFAACGGQKQSHAPAYASSHSTASAESGAYEGSGTDRDDVDDGSAYDSAESEERPGLGTTFGEQVESRVRERAFVRATESPFAQAGLLYNDEDGVIAQAQHHGAELHEISASSPGGGIHISTLRENPDHTSIILQEERNLVTTAIHGLPTAFVAGSGFCFSFRIGVGLGHAKLRRDLLQARFIDIAESDEFQLWNFLHGREMGTGGQGPAADAADTD